MRFICGLGMFIARLCIAAIFIISGIGKFMAPDVTGAFMALKGITHIPLFLYSAATIEVVFGLAVVFGFKTRIFALLLALYLIPVTYIFHDFWAITEPGERTLQLIHFLANLSIFGGLLSLVFGGSGNTCHHKEGIK